MGFLIGRSFRFWLTKEQGHPCPPFASPFAEKMPEPAKNLHQGNLLRRGFAALTQNLARLRDGISEGGSEEQALRTPPERPQEATGRALRALGVSDQRGDAGRAPRASTGQIADPASLDGHCCVLPESGNAPAARLTIVSQTAIESDRGSTGLLWCKLIAPHIKKKGHRKCCVRSRFCAQRSSLAKRTPLEGRTLRP